MQKKNTEAQTFHCEIRILSTMPEMLWEKAEFEPTLVCHNEKFRTYVMPKISPETTISENVQTVSHIPCQSDIYDLSTCRPIEFFGNPSVYCEGEKTMVAYTPHFQSRFFDQCDSQIMLGAILYQGIKSTVTWVNGKLYGERKKLGAEETPILCEINSTYAKEMFKNFEKELNKIENQLHTKKNNENFRWAFSVLEEHCYSLSKFQNSKGTIPTKELEEFELTIYEFKNELIDDLKDYGTDFSQQNEFIDKPLSSGIRGFGLFAQNSSSQKPFFISATTSFVADIKQLTNSSSSVSQIDYTNKAYL